MVDRVRTDMFVAHKHGSDEAKDYLYREHMVRRRISEFALKLSKEVTDKITGQGPEEKSFVATCVKNRELYPKPVKKS